MQTKETSIDRNEHGKDFTVRLNGDEIPFTHLQYSIDPSKCYTKNKPTERPISGSLEYTGHNERIRQVVEKSTDSDAELLALEIKSPNEHIRCSVCVEDYARDASGDDLAHTTVVWEGILLEFVDETSPRDSDVPPAYR